MIRILFGRMCQHKTYILGLVC